MVCIEQGEKKNYGKKKYITICSLMYDRNIIDWMCDYKHYKRKRF